MSTIASQPSVFDQPVCRSVREQAVNRQQDNGGLYKGLDWTRIEACSDLVCLYLRD
jgi:hypothetical protein